MLSRNNIAYNLYKTPHLLAVGYEDQNVIYHFSSELYMNKFVQRLDENRDSIKKSLSGRFGFSINCDSIADLRLYSSIEKRGFLISVNGEYVECLNNIILSGQTIRKNS